MLKKPRGPFRRIGAGIERAVIGQHMHAQAGDAAVLGRRDFGRHVVVARERCGGEIPRCDPPPISRQAGDDGGDDGAP